MKKEDKKMKKSALVFFVRPFRCGWIPAAVVKSHKEAEELARKRARVHWNESNFDPLAWKVKRVSTQSDEYIAALQWGEPYLEE